MAMSYLMIEAGRLAVRAAYLDVVEGQYRFVAGGEACIAHQKPPGVSTAIREAIAALEKATGHRMLGSAGPIVPERSDGSGVDGIVMTSGELLRVATAG